MIDMDDWSDVMVPQIEKRLDNPRNQVLVVADPTSTDNIANLFGHLVWRPAEGDMPPLIYFCYVKKDHRGNGFARGLLKAAGIDPTGPYNYVCRTYALIGLYDAGKMPRASWRPLLGRQEYERKEQDERETSPE